MRYEHAAVLLDFAKLNLEIAIAKNPIAAMDMSEANITRSVGYKRLRAFFVSLSPKKQAAFCADCKRQIDGIREVMRQAASTGEKLSIAEIEISTFDGETRTELTPEHLAAHDLETDDKITVREQMERLATRAPKDPHDP